MSLEDILQKILSRASGLGAEYADARAQEVDTLTVTVENDALRAIESMRSKGIGIRVLCDGAWGFSSTNALDTESVERAVSDAVSAARAAAPKAKKARLCEVYPVEVRVQSPFKVDPFSVDMEEIVKLCFEANKSALISDEIKSRLTRLGIVGDKRFFASSEGSFVEVSIVMTGFAHHSTAMFEGKLEFAADSRSRCAGYEFIREGDWNAFASGLSKSAMEAVRARTPPPGTYPVVVDGRMVGLLLHEAFGHASEGDLVETGASVLVGRIGEKIASDLVTIVDDGLMKDGYLAPFDDEGVRKKRVVVVREGVLEDYISSRESAANLRIEPSGNARAEGFAHPPIVRQTNYFMERGDHSFEELVEGVKEGIYITAVGSGGGQVDPSIGSFTFRAGLSYAIKDGEVKEMLRGVVISGLILETLKTVEAVGKDFRVETTVFGGCGKGGQMVRVGDGGPTVRVGRMTVGGV